eukprot:TRINITY_DN14892_c0_g1_i1.p1 TRINITY_DN14892_c0_g1~~TRINITY_DN14892_c0_g1_i1.p1  ORF type:complete len:885 (+),score=190.49 TRINITY_DN14892_c0_g1_i1:33-2687(+)
MAASATSPQEERKVTEILSSFDNRALWEDESRRMSQRHIDTSGVNIPRNTAGTPTISKKSPIISPKDQSKVAKKEKEKEKKERDRLAKEREKMIKREKKDRKTTFKSDSNHSSARESSPTRSPNSFAGLERSGSKDSTSSKDTSPKEREKRPSKIGSIFGRKSAMKIVDDRRASVDVRINRANSTLALSSSRSDPDLNIVGAMTINGLNKSLGRVQPSLTEVFRSPPMAREPDPPKENQIKQSPSLPVKLERASNESIRKSNEDVTKKFEEAIANHRNSKSSDESSFLPPTDPASDRFSNTSRRSSVEIVVQLPVRSPDSPRRRAISTADLLASRMAPPSPDAVRPAHRAQTQRLRRKNSLLHEMTMDEHQSLMRKSLRWLPRKHLTLTHEINIESLPRDAFIHIFKYLQFDELVKASMVCGQWLELSKEPIIWKSLFSYYEPSLITKSPSEKNIWQDESIPKPDELLQNAETYDPNKMTLNQLVVRLTPNQYVPDPFTSEVFLRMYKTFTTTENLVRKMLERYDVPSCPNPNSTFEDQEQWRKNVVNPIQLRVCKILKLLIDNNYNDLSPDVIRLLKVFAKGSQCFDPTGTLSNSLKNSFKKALGVNPVQSMRPGFKPPSMKIKKHFKGNSGDILDDVSTKDLAEQLCLLEFEFFKEIKPEEWMKPGDKANKQRTDEMIEHFNIISIWVQEYILSAEKVRSRARRMERFIRVAVKLRELNNFETMMAIISSLSDSAIFRLNFTKAEVSKDLLKKHEELQELMSGERGYIRYREALKEVTCPCVPYIGVHRRDLIYHAETDQSKTKDDVVDFKRKTYIYNIVKEIQRWQSTPYTFPTIPAVYAALRVLPKPQGNMTTDQYKEGPLWQLSLKREPKNATKNSLMW